ncbi:MAG: hypothetical protein HYV09_21980 [Deltaproteobacteria bacterium]|nr:hypothetical protein [Deltaproteobacteria bacterium]
MVSEPPTLDAKTMAVAVDRSTPSPQGGMGCLIGFLVLLAFVFGAWIPLRGAPLLPDGFIFGSVGAIALTLLVCMPLARAAGGGSIGRAMPPREALAHATAFALFGIGLAIGAEWLLAHPILHGRWSLCMACNLTGGGWQGLLAIIALAGGLGGPVLAAFAGIFWKRGVPGRVNVIVARALAWSLVLAVGSAVVAGAVAARRKQGGFPEFIASLELVAELPPPPRASHPPSPSGPAAKPEPPPVVTPPWRPAADSSYYAPVAGLPGATGLLVERQSVYLSRPRGDGSGSTEFSRLSSGVETSERWTGPPGRLYVHRDARHDLYFLSAEHARSGRTDGVIPSRIAFRASDGVQVEVRASDLADVLAPPLLWTLVAALGLPIALALLLRRPPIASLRPFRERWFSVTRDDDGLATLPSGVRVDWPESTASPEIVVIVDGTTAADGYRGPVPDAVQVIPCSRETLEASIDMAEVARAISAIAVLLVTGAPLLLVVAHGLAP